MPADQLRYAIRPAQLGDVAAINEIYNHYVSHSTCTYQSEPVTLESGAEWFKAHDAEHPALVAEGDGGILGWASASMFHSRFGYRHTVEDSVYIRDGLHGRGLGTALLSDLLGRCKAIGHHAMIAGISADQEPSVALHKKFGFTEVARLKEVGRKFDRWLDVIYMEKLL